MYIWSYIVNYVYRILYVNGDIVCQSTAVTVTAAAYLVKESFKSEMLTKYIRSIWIISMLNNKVDDQSHLSRSMTKQPEDHWSCIAHLSAEDMLN